MLNIFSVDRTTASQYRSQENLVVDLNSSQCRLHDGIFESAEQDVPPGVSSPSIVFKTLKKLKFPLVVSVKLPVFVNVYNIYTVWLCTDGKI